MRREGDVETVGRENRGRKRISRNERFVTFPSQSILPCTKSADHAATPDLEPMAPPQPESAGPARAQQRDYPRLGAALLHSCGHGPSAFAQSRARESRLASEFQ